MDDQMDELIREIAAKHGIAVARDDPILVLQTINQRLLADSAKAQQVQLDAYKKEMEELAHRWGFDAKVKAERILNAALAASKETMFQMAQQGSESASAAVNSALDTALLRLQVHSSEIGRIALWNLIAAALVFATAIIFLYVTLSCSIPPQKITSYLGDPTKEIIVLFDYTKPKGPYGFSSGGAYFRTIKGP